jgi:phosphatidylserine/phosphatidylglycerophosphate/cardiolipin synthase-like enzyme
MTVSSSTAGERAGDERLVIEPQDRRDEVLAVIRSAKRRLILSIFRCNDFKVLDGIGEAVRRGVTVEALLTGRAKGGKRKLQELYGILENLGVRVRTYADPVVKYHAKYVVADEGPALVASLNFTKKCFTRTLDFMVVTYDPAVVSGLTRLFECDWESPAAVFPEDLTRRLIVGPERARAQLTELLQQARRSIHVIDAKLGDPAMIDLLAARKADGVAVTVLGEAEIQEPEPHGKLILIDERVAVLGSLALSALSLDFRREVALVVRERRAVSRLEAMFQSIARAAGDRTLQEGSGT